MQPNPWFPPVFRRYDYQFPGCLAVDQAPKPTKNTQNGPPSRMFAGLFTGLFAGTITGQIQTSTGGAVANGTLIFTLSQPAILARHRASDQPALWDAFTSARFEEAALPRSLRERGG